jgi:hypothetical protein
MSRPVRVLLIGVGLCVVLGIVGGAIGIHFGAPFYFGFFFGFVLTGLVTLFRLASVLSGPSGR